MNTIGSLLKLTGIKNKTNENQFQSSLVLCMFLEAYRIIPI